MATPVIKNVWTQAVGFAPILRQYFIRCGIQRIIDENVELDPRRKHTTDRHKKQLVGCRRLVAIEAFFQVAFKTSIFTKLATRCGFS